MNKTAIVLAFVAALSIPGGFLLAQQAKENPRPEELNVPGQIETYSGGDKALATNYFYPDNSTKPESQLTKKENAIGQLKKGLNLKQTKLMKYSQYLQDKKQRGGDIIENLQIHPNRLVWVSEIDAPEGLEVPQKNGNRAKFRKSEIIIVTDAETGTQLSTDIIEQM